MSTVPERPDAGRRGFTIRLSRRAARQLSGGLPEKIATAVAEFLDGPLGGNPRRVGKPLSGEYAGQYSARRGRDWRIRYTVDEAARTVLVLDVSHRSDTYGT